MPSVHVSHYDECTTFGASLVRLYRDSMEMQRAKLVSVSVSAVRSLLKADSAIAARLWTRLIKVNEHFRMS